MPTQRRIDSTRDKTRRGGLPAPTEHSRRIGVGDGSPCDGCGESIHPTELLFAVTFLGALERSFHDVCYEAWSTFTRA